MRLWCALFGHTDVLLPRPGRLAVTCTSCGRESSGIAVGRPAYRRTHHGKGNPTRIRRRLARMYLAHRLLNTA